MRFFLFFLGAFVCPAMLTAQISSSSILLGSSVRFNTNTYGPFARYQNIGGIGTPVTGVVYNTLERRTSYQVSPYLGYSVGKHWILGGGVSVSKEKTVQNPDREATTTGSGFSTVTIVPYSELGSTIVTPRLFAEIYHRLGERFYLSGAVSAEYSFGKTYNNVSNLASYPSTGAVNISEAKTQAKTQAYALSATPLLRFNALKHFGVQLAFGGIALVQKVKDTSVPNYEVQRPDFKIDFGPTNWEIGVYLNFGGKG